MNNNSPENSGWTWLKQGAGLFRQQPAALTTLLFANILASLLISAVPFIGPMIAVVLIPSFSMAFMMGCAMIDSGQRVTPVVVLTGFRKPVLRELCKIGVVYLGVTLLLTLLMRVVVPAEFWAQVSAAQETPDAATAVAGSHLAALFGMFALNVIALILLSFAGPLAYWQNMAPLKAVFYSVFAVKRSAGKILRLLLSWAGIFFFVCMVLVMLLGVSSISRVVMMWTIFLFVLVLQCALYAAYRDIFGKPELGPADKVSLEK